jgi:acyl dehydratase
VIGACFVGVVGVTGALARVGGGLVSAAVDPAALDMGEGEIKWRNPTAAPATIRTVITREAKRSNRRERSSTGASPEARGGTDKPPPMSDWVSRLD